MKKASIMVDEAVNWYKEGLRDARNQLLPGGWPSGSLGALEAASNLINTSWQGRPWRGGTSERHEAQLVAVITLLNSAVRDFTDTLTARCGYQPDTVDTDDWRARFGGHRPISAY